MTLTHTHTYTFPVTGKCPHCSGPRKEIHVAKGETPTHRPAAYFEAPRYQFCNLCCPCSGQAVAPVEPMQLALLEATQ